jgi:hypothetical protein
MLNIPTEVAESIIIANQSELRPESYISYEYSKSKSNSNQK